MFYEGILMAKYDTNPGFFKHVSWHDAKVSATPQELETLFGEPNAPSAEAPIDYRFLMISQEEGYRAITLYAIGHEERIKRTERIDFHIGGNGKRETSIALNFINALLEKVRDGEVQRNVVLIKDGAQPKCPFGKEIESWLECGACPLRAEGSIADGKITCMKKSWD